MIRLPSEILTALETVLDYYWQDEERHYEETPEEDRDDHIFTRLKIVQAFVNADTTVAVYQSDQTATRYEVQTEMFSGWENCWTDGDGKPVTYTTRAEAIEAIADHIIECVDAVESGDMIDAPEPSEFRIVEVTP
ncbi:MAG: hypothetical protein K2X03_11000 [Bryobacteraceae bacterium]|nr:hypothetical protein [Bryobacteraceae bacterium]